MIVVNNPNISLYCLDLQNQRAIFVETPSDIDLSQAPFFYQIQYNYAQKLIAVPLEELHLLANDVKPIEQLIVIYSVGRCGSTLLSKVFNQVDTVLSLSEPDIFSQIVGLRNVDRSNDEEIVELLKACIHLLGKSTVQGDFSCIAIKLRSFAIELGDLIYRAFPNSKNIFLYRNAEDVVKSSIRSFVFLGKMLPAIKDNIDFYSRFIPLLKDYSDDIDYLDSRAIDIYIIAWLSVMQKYLLMHQYGITTCAVRYEDLVKHPHDIISLLFEKCDLPLEKVKNTYKVFQSDSQTGSNLSRENTRNNEPDRVDILDLDILKKTENLLKKHPVIKTSSFIVPNTLGCSN